MVKFTNDYLVTPEHSNGDLSLTIDADSGDAAIQALRQVLRETRDKFVPRWTQQVFDHIVPTVAPGEAPVRNLLGFKDGTANLDGEVLDEYIRPVGGGFFFVPPAPATGEILGEQLLA